MGGDRELMARVVDGDGEAFDEVLARHGEAVRLRVRRIVRDEAAAEDLCQEVFLRLWTKGGQWDGRGALAAWLGRVATNLSLNHLRSVRRRRQQALEVPAEAGNHGLARVPSWLVDASAAEPAEAAEQAELMEHVARLIEELPAAKRGVLRLVHEEDLNVGEAAEELGIPVGTVKSRLHGARSALARELESLLETMGDI